jgi:hypothetical protein
MRKNKEKIEVYLLVDMKKMLKSKADLLGITMSELIKRMLEEYLK